jgi:tRNA-specific 2-thiouridylase
MTSESMRTAVLLSGGVDSSVALALAQESGRQNLTAYYLKIWLEDDVAHLGNCPWEEDLKYARAVCEHLGVPLEVVSLQTAYQERVVSYVIDELKAGHTPSPDIFCNQRIKFGAFLDLMGERVDRVISGHYATVDRSTDRARLMQAVDPVKDQTYFLSHLSQKQLDLCEFPVGVYPKVDVRKIAESRALPTMKRPDSQGICFLGKIPYNDFIRFHLGDRVGKIVHLSTGKILGEHRGFWFHTVGQRKGLGLSGGPWFVAGKDLQENVVYVAHADEESSILKDRFIVDSPNWLQQPEESSLMRIKVRHGPRMVDAKVEHLGEQRWMVTMSQPDRGLATGQFCVFYRQDGQCLGGGMIQAQVLPRTSSPTLNADYVTIEALIGRVNADTDPEFRL